jgi:peptidoglycan hydrolase-like protein with peptidoglycan-binding domain
MAWRRIMCETNITSDVVVRIQRALLNAGHSPGPIDGVIGKQTMTAVRKYQKAKSLAVGNLTYETLNSLGVKITTPSS